MLRRTPLKRKTGLKRSRFKRKPRGPNPAGSDPAHLQWIREQPCCVCGTLRNVEAHHSTVGRGLSQKTADREAMPLCSRCHFELHNYKGYFHDWSKQRRAAWQKLQSTIYAPGGQTV